jgi:hypothetical protein
LRSTSWATPPAWPSPSLEYKLHENRHPVSQAYATTFPVPELIPGRCIKWTLNSLCNVLWAKVIIQTAMCEGKAW